MNIEAIEKFKSNVIEIFIQIADNRNRDVIEIDSNIVADTMIFSADCDKKLIDKSFCFSVDCMTIFFLFNNLFANCFFFMKIELKSFLMFSINKIEKNVQRWNAEKFEPKNFEIKIKIENDVWTWKKSTD